MTNKINVSKRLETVAHMVTDGVRLADVGTDHGFVPILLIQENKIKSALAMDLRKGPLERADLHIRELGLGDRIKTRLSDGMKALKKDEADAVVVAGMGGGLIIRILSDVDPVELGIKEMVLGPQSDIDKVREYLDEKGYVIDKEDMVFEEGKYYQILHVLTEPGVENKFEEADMVCEEVMDKRLEYLYGRHLLSEKNETMMQFLNYEKEGLNKIYAGLKKSVENDGPSEKIEGRLKEIEELMELNSKAIRGDFFGNN